MTYTICEHVKGEVFAEFVLHNASDGGLLQSEIWKEFQRNVGVKSFTVLISDEQRVRGSVSVYIEKKGPFKTLYIPRGPIGDVSVFEELLKGVKEMAKQEGALFCDIDPLQEGELSGIELTHTRQPQETLILDLHTSEDDLRAQMKSKTRYNISVAKKHGVTVEKGRDSKLIEAFLSLVKKTAKRQSIGIHSAKYYKTMIETLGEQASIYVAYKEDIPIASHLMVYSGSVATYLHGASDYTYRQMMAPYLLQWQQIRDAKENGFTQYDFWGVATYGLLKEKWAGITRFKFGFSKDPVVVSYPRALRIIYRPYLYWVFRVLQFVKQRV